MTGTTFVPPISTDSPTTLWRHADFRRYWLSQTVSRAGVNVAELVLPLAAITMFDASAEELGWINSAAFAPYLLLSLLAGVWIDRRRKRTLLVTAEIGRIVALAAIPALALAGLIQVDVLIVIAFLLGICAVLFDVSGSAYLPSLVGRDQLLDGNSKLQASIVVTNSGGPALGGLLMQALAAPVVLGMSAVTSLVSLIALAGIRQAEEPPPQPTGKTRTASEIGEALRFIARDRYLRFLTVRSGVNNLFFIARNTVLPLFVLQVLDLGSAALGLVLGVGAIGALVGAGLAKRLADRLGPGRVIAVGYGVASVVQILLPAASGPPALALGILLLMFFVSGMFMTIGNTNVATFQQMLVPRRQLGRVIAGMRTVTWGSMPIGALLGGILGARIGIRETLILTATGFCLSALWIAFSPIAKLREMPAARQD